MEGFKVKSIIEIISGWIWWWMPMGIVIWLKNKAYKEQLKYIKNRED